MIFQRHHSLAFLTPSEIAFWLDERRHDEYVESFLRRGNLSAGENASVKYNVGSHRLDKFWMKPQRTDRTMAVSIGRGM